ncbi:MAG: DUF4266 domain-containing protein [Myxococcales bacterium]|nr:DUF4266 domain-containing protein [Myxococcales bacterium]
MKCGISRIQRACEKIWVRALGVDLAADWFWKTRVISRVWRRVFRNQTDPKPPRRSRAAIFSQAQSAIWVGGIVLIAAVALSGCAVVRPWERAVLMQRVMTPVSDPMQSAFDTHVFRTREAMSGAEVSGGVSCGCN